MLKQYPRWLLVALIFFIVWHFFLTTLMWHNRQLPPEPDDALIYSGHIYSVLRCPHVLCDTPTISLHMETGYDFLSYRLLWGLAAKLLGLNSIAMLHVSFYLGIVALALASLFLLSRLALPVPLQAFSLFILSLFYGGGGYHGFFWVVPSFFSLVLFFIIFSLLVEPRSRYQTALLFLLTPVFTFAHPLSFYLLFAIACYVLLYSWFTYHIDWALVRRSIVVILIGVSCSFSASWYLRHNILPYTLSSPSVVQSSHSAKPQAAITTTSSWLITTFPSLTDLKNDYLNWLFPHWSGLLVFGFFLYMLVHYRYYRLLALFCASSLFVLVSCMQPHGTRAVLVLWPITFLVYAVGFWHSFIFSTHYFSSYFARLFSRVLIGGALALFVIATIVYSLVFTLTINAKNNLKISMQWVPYLLNTIEPQDPVFVRDKLLIAYALNTELVTHPAQKNGKLKYTVTYDEPPSSSQPSLLDTFFTTSTKLFKGSKNQPVAQAPVQKIEPTPDPYADLVLKYNVDGVKVYRHPSYK